ncbi:MAG TPA: hypothetical protein VFE90_01850 [Myxococcales bacterium]|jgi:hypothetical protein|nr:hypothetical protein [Myxococcales bacterium]
MRACALVVVVAACAPKQPPFSMPKNVEDVRARLLFNIPEGREIAEARGWMRDHGFDCDAPLPSATDAHAHVCQATAAAPADAGWRRWTIVLYERRGRLADVSARK